MLDVVAMCWLERKKRTDEEDTLIRLYSILFSSYFCLCAAHHSPASYVFFFIFYFHVFESLALETASRDQNMVMNPT